MKQFYLFDLDGTLTDPKEGITKGIQYALSKYGIQVDDLDELDKFIGPPLYEAFIEYYGFSGEKSREAITKYREYFAETGIYQNMLYDGVTDMLTTLKGKGKTLLLATSKPAVFAERVLRYFDLAEYFSFAAGSELDGRRTRKSAVINYALENMGVTDLEACVMVGDREHDVIGAREVGIESVGVLYGYGSRVELESAGAHYIAGTVGELCALLEKLG